MNIKETINFINEAISSLGLSNKVSKKYSEKKPEDVFDYVTNIDSLKEFFRENGASVSEFAASTWSNYLNTNYVCFHVVFPDRKRVDVKYSKEFEKFSIADSEVDNCFLRIAKENPEFRKYFNKDDRIAFGKFKLNKEHPIPKFVLDIILEEIQKRKE